jgi:hypothetical protein
VWHDGHVVDLSADEIDIELHEGNQAP